MTLHMMTQLAEVVTTLQGLKKGIVIVTGQGMQFCSGGHLQEVQRELMSPEHGSMMSGAMTAILEALFNLPCLTVAAVAGVAVGGGAELAMACDLRVFHPAAALHFVHARLGIVPGWGGTSRLLSLVGRQQTLKVLAESRRLSASEALDCGLADYVVGGQWPEAVGTFLLERFPVTLEAVAGVKRQLLTSQSDAGVDGGCDVFSSLWASEFHQAAVARAVGRKSSS